MSEDAKIPFSGPLKDEEFKNTHWLVMQIEAWKKEEEVILTIGICSDTPTALARKHSGLYIYNLLKAARQFCDEKILALEKVADDMRLTEL